MWSHSPECSSCHSFDRSSQLLPLEGEEEVQEGQETQTCQETQEGIHQEQRVARFRGSGSGVKAWSPGEKVPLPVSVPFRPLSLPRKKCSGSGRRR